MCLSVPRRRRRWTLTLTLLAMTLALVVGGLLWHSAETASISALQGQVTAMTPWLASLRFSVIVLVALLWPALLAAWHRCGGISDPRRSVLLAARWRIVAWLLLLEIVVGQNLLGQLISAVQGARP